MSNRPDISRRALLRHAGIGSLALQTMLAAPNKRGPHGSGLLPTASDFAPRAKAIIQLVQNGGPSQMDLFDPKPELQRLNGKQHTFKVDTFQPGSESNELLGSPFEFRKAGRAGMDFSELLTLIAESNPAQIDIVHGYAAPLAHILRQRGYNAREAQL